MVQPPLPDSFAAESAFSLNELGACEDETPLASM